MPTGTVKSYNPDTGYGFLIPDEGGRDVFVHARAAEKAGLWMLEPGQRLYYELIKRKQDGKYSAENLREVEA